MSYTLPLTCPRCGGVTRHVASGRPIAYTEVGAICQCATCRQRWHVLVTLRPALEPESIKRRKTVTA